MQPYDSLREGERLMTICNACRYCEGYCAVFPAMERRRSFADADLRYLANLCHNCGACYDACQYAPPHEFAVDVPKVLAEIRERSYRHWQHWYSSLLTTSIVVAVCVAAFVWTAQGRSGSFYSVISHRAMVALFGAASIFVLAVLGAGVARCWREAGASMNAAAVAAAMRDAGRLRYLGGARRWFHHFTFYGFLLCFAATSTAALYHYALGLRAPYALLSLPVILGVLGGIGLLIGPPGLYLLRREPADASFLALLFLTGLTGFLLLALRASAAMPALLGIHLGVVMALFLTMPYGKFVHGSYRLAALTRYALETAALRREQDRRGQTH